MYMDWQVRYHWQLQDSEQTPIHGIVGLLVL